MHYDKGPPPRCLPQSPHHPRSTPGPRHGHIYDNMRVTRAHFKYALRFVRNQEDMARADSLAQDLSDQDVDGFWKTMHKMNNCNTILANVIDGVSGPDSIASHWKQHFDKLLNVHCYTRCVSFTLLCI